MLSKPRHRSEPDSERLSPGRPAEGTFYGAAPRNAVVVVTERGSSSGIVTTLVVTGRGQMS